MVVSSDVAIRSAKIEDLESILQIYNQGIEDRIATLETDPKDQVYIQQWFEGHQGRHAVLVAEADHQVVGWASLNPYSHRCAYQGVADLSIYIHRDYRGQGIGSALLPALEEEAARGDFYKIVLFTFPFNQKGQGLYRKLGYREVGVFKDQGILDGERIDVMIMEKVFNEI
ncbi:N-acetyltransferase [Paenibacillus sp. HN-1]|uniref:arsinothricin resistance N-acetyltransferase ArsN1 family A n=1 Tax=Paenibacillus TaxID=44249 RepID=UPI001CA7D3AF|nr:MULTISPECIES: arsinothricin resistance N-acetyltransferase ArsN1 family A [Paenibacillus]MBY9079327.1 N-acetyltransferase [Paenibacillus sp. CGMCC 1.18879]MBY9087050.1 N-acetyltransferase [Paenibacillus sinensis]